MSEKKPINPPAFPAFNSSGTPTYNSTTLRDYFASEQMHVFLKRYPRDEAGFIDYDLCARSAYRAADAMLKERERNNDEESPTT